MPSIDLTGLNGTDGWTDSSVPYYSLDPIERWGLTVRRVLFIEYHKVISVTFVNKTYKYQQPESLNLSDMFITAV